MMAIFRGNGSTSSPSLSGRLRFRTNSDFYFLERYNLGCGLNCTIAPLLLVPPARVVMYAPVDVIATEPVLYGLAPSFVLPSKVWSVVVCHVLSPRVWPVAPSGRTGSVGSSDIFDTVPHPQPFSKGLGQDVSPPNTVVNRKLFLPIGVRSDNGPNPYP